MVYVCIASSNFIPPFLRLLVPMHSRKGSLSLSPWPSRARTGTRWTGLFILIFISVLLLHQSRGPLWFLPSHELTHSCSIEHAYPIVIAPPNRSFDWKNIAQQHPVDNLAQLPFQTREVLPTIQYDFSQDTLSYRKTAVRKGRQAAVKAIFKQYWSAHKNIAGDGTQPISMDQNTMIMDSLETFRIMGLRKEFEEAIAAITGIDLAPNEQATSLTQATRLLSALLSAYDLTTCQDTRLLGKAVELGDMLYTFFDTPNRLPITWWNATKAANSEEQEVSQHVTPADLSSYSLAFIRLSQLTGDMRFYDAVTRVTAVLASQQSRTKIAGLWPVDINLQNLDFTSNDTFDLQTTSYSVYAHHALMARFLATSPAASPYTTVSTNALDATIQHLLFRPITPTNASILMASTAYTTPTGHITRTHTVDASSCALGSTLALSAALNLNDTYLTYARFVTKGCIWTSLRAPPSPFGHINIMPDSFSMLACSSAALKNSAQNCTFEPLVWPTQEYPGFERIWDTKRTTIRPELVMSLFTLYRVTGEERWRDVAWEMWTSVERVVAARLKQMHDNNATTDEEEFRTTTQTLKFFYLLFGEPGMLSLDEWVFGSDGHALWAGKS